MGNDASQPAPGGAIGADATRVDGLGKIVGAARYVDDLIIEGLWHGATVRSPHASARITAVDAAPALAADPAVAVVTAADLPGPNVVKLIVDDWPILAADEVHHVGEPVALVAAPTRARALAAAARVAVTYEPRQAACTLDEALAGDPRAGGDGPLVLKEIAIDHTDVAAGFAQADVVIEGTYETGYQEHIYIEPQGMIARWQGGAVEILGSMQCPYYIHKAMTHAFGTPDDAVRVRQVTTGGGFGGKEDFPDVLAIHAALLARAAGHPVKIIYDRHEDIVATTKRHPSRVHLRTGLRRDGTLVAIDADVILDAGAYTTLSPVVLSRGVIHAAGAYRCPHVRVRGRAIATNTATNGAFRGFGAPQTLFAIERHMDRIGRALEIDPVTLRKHNAYRLGDTTPTLQTLTSSVSAHECLRVALERTDFVDKWHTYEAAREARAPDDPAPMRGIGLSLFWHGSGFTGNGEHRMKARAAVELAPDGRLCALAASTDIGQGTDTVFRQIVADMAGVAFDDVDVADHDTAMVPDSGPTVASRTVMVVGELLGKAAARVAEAVAGWSAEERGLPADGARVEGGRVRAGDGTDLGAFRDVAAACRAAVGPQRTEEVFGGGDADPIFDEETYRGIAYGAYGWGCDVVEVEVCPDTLQARPTRVTAVCDVGKVINPTLCKGQVEGGTLQAVAWGYMEEIKTESGRYLNDRLQTYIIPTAADAPDFDVVLVENPAPTGPKGAKGVGELPMDGGAPALLAAIENATGLSCPVAPATPERLFALQQAAAAPARAPGLALVEEGDP